MGLFECLFWLQAMERAMQFHETLQNLIEWLDSNEEKLDDMGVLGSDIDVIKQQIEELKVNVY